MSNIKISRPYVLGGEVLSIKKTYHSPTWSFLIMIDPTILAGNKNLVLRTFHG